MKRMEEYQELLTELDGLTENIEMMETTEEVVDRAIARKKRKNLVFRPLVGFAASFALFVILVNYSATVADACAEVPVLRELAEAVTFSPSLEDAVDNEYAQPLNLFDQDGEVSGKVEFLIVDQKQVNIFFRVFSDKYEELYIDPGVAGINKELGSHSLGLNNWDVPNGELQSVTVDFVEDNVPSSMKLQLDIRAADLGEQEFMTEEEMEEEQFNPEGPSEDEYVACLEFELEFDPQFTAKGEKIEVNQIVELEGQKISIDTLEVYPTHMRINISDIEENTAWLKRLDFYVITEKRKKFEPVKEGITATGSTDNNTMTSYRADSTYFHNAKTLKLVITGAEWLNKDMEKVYVNLKGEEAEVLPKGVELYSAEEKKGGWIVRFKVKNRQKDHLHQVITSTYYDKNGNEYYIKSSATGFWSELDKSEQDEYFIEELRLTDYHQDEIWLKPAYSHEWSAKTPIVVNCK